MKRSEMVINAMYGLTFLSMAIVSFYRMFYGVGAHSDYYLYPAFTSLASLGIIFIPVFLRFSGRIYLPTWFVGMIFLALFLHCLGVVERFYDSIPWWDNMTHILSSMLVSAMGFIAMALIDWYVDSIYIPPKVMPFIIISLGCSFGVIWEILEWSFDCILGSMTQYSLADTLEDLLMDLTGASAMGVTGWFFMKFESPGDLAQNLGVDKYLRRLGNWWDSRVIQQIR